jgi:signal transduction histidine kinase
VLVNLLLNSLDALASMREPSLTVKTSCRQQWYVVQVIDNGCGIKPEHINRVFEPFFTTKPVGKGTGLGLSISHNLIKRMGGTIDVWSQVGVGTTVTVHLPLPDLADVPAPVQAAEKP